MDKNEFQNLVKLAKLKLSPESEDTFLDSFNKILGYISAVGKVDTSSVSDDDIYEFLENITRPDLEKNSLTRDDLSNIAPAYENGFVVVPRVIET